MDHPKHILNQHNIETKKSLGQNFLFDDSILARIVAAAELTPSDHVLEIGPGLGHLTQHLAQQVERVVAVELDDRLIPLLRLTFATMPHVELVHADILALNLAHYFADHPYKVVANVPYYITGGILRYLLTSQPRPTRLVITVQQEVAERLTAEPGRMSLLAISVQLFGKPVVVGKVKAGAFWPRPDVDSAIVCLDLAQTPQPDVDEAAFFRVARAGFSQKRKQLKNNLQQLPLSAAVIAAALEATHIDGQRRAETLSVAEWVALARALPLP